MTIKDLKFLKINSANTLHLIFNKVNGYFGEIKGNKYSMLVRTNESKGKSKKFDKQWSKIRDLIRSKTQMNILKNI